MAQLSTQHSELSTGLRAVIFDVDGTLLDSAEFIYGAFEHVLRERKLPERPRSDMAAVMGRSLKECYRALILAGGAACGTGFQPVGHGQAAHATDAELDALCHAHREFQKSHLDLPQPFPGVIEVLEELARRGLRMAAVTTRSKVSSVATLERCGLARFFGTIVSAEDVQQIKPHPEPVLKALAALEVPPRQAVMVGDTFVDIEAGAQAGTRTIGVLYGFHGEALAGACPDFVIRNIRELPKIIDALRR